MIVWSGKGVFSVLVLVLTFVLLVMIMPSGKVDLIFMLSFFVTAAFSWFMGKKWNQQEGKIYVDKETGQEIELKPNHSLFWIKMEYWGIVFGVFGAIILVQQFL
ncbi:MAG: hypothetical protein OCD76_09665 [Reichenbachiella sp.]